VECIPITCTAWIRCWKAVSRVRSEIHMNTSTPSTITITVVPYVDYTRSQPAPLVPESPRTASTG